MIVDFIIPTFDREKELNSMLSSLLAQSNPNWSAKVICDMASRDAFNHLGQHDELDERIHYHFMDKRYNDWGHTPRETGKQMSDSDYIIMTGDDNYYTPNAVHEIILACQSSPGIVYWDMVHSHYDYSYFKCNLAFNQIDMGAFATRRDLAHQLPLGTQYAADGLFVENFKHTFPNETIVKIDKILFVHN